MALAYITLTLSEPNSLGTNSLIVTNDLKDLERMGWPDQVKFHLHFSQVVQGPLFLGGKFLNCTQTHCLVKPSPCFMHSTTSPPWPRSTGEVFEDLSSEGH